MKMNVRSIYDHDEGHYTSFVALAHSNKNEDWKGFDKSFDDMYRHKYGVTEAKFLLLKAWYESSMDDLKEDTDFYDDDGNFVPPISLKEFINTHKHYSEASLRRWYCLVD